VLDGPRGFFATACEIPVREFLGGLGERWHTGTNSFKLYPVCGYLCSALDATLALVAEHDVQAEEVEAVDVWASIFTVGMDAHSAPYLDGPRSRIATLTFSTPFTVASAILARELTPEQLKRPWIEKPQVWLLAARVRSRHDPRLTLAALTADIPLGAALRRTRRIEAAAFGWGLAGKAFGRRGRWRRPAQTLRLVAGLAAAAGESAPLDFGRSTKPLGARVEMRLSGGRRLSRTVAIPRGFAGGGSQTEVRRWMQRKLVDAASGRLGPERAARVADRFADLERLSPTAVVELLELAAGGGGEAAGAAAGSARSELARPISAVPSFESDP